MTLNGLRFTFEHISILSLSTVGEGRWLHVPRAQTYTGSQLGPDCGKAPPGQGWTPAQACDGSCSGMWMDDHKKRPEVKM